MPECRTVVAVSVAVLAALALMVVAAHYWAGGGLGGGLGARPVFECDQYGMCPPSYTCDPATNLCRTKGVGARPAVACDQYGMCPPPYVCDPATNLCRAR